MVREIAGLRTETIELRVENAILKRENRFYENSPPSQNNLRLGQDIKRILPKA